MSISCICEGGIALPVFAEYKNYARTTSDGVIFLPARFYDVASKNIGILMKCGNKTHGWASRLFANPGCAEHHVEKIVKEYEKLSPEERDNFKKANSLI